jgi:transcriptional regulator
MKERTIFKSYLFLTSEEEGKWTEEIAERMNEDIDEEELKVDADEYAVFERLQEDIECTYDDTKLNLNKTLPNNIIAFGSVGRWNGNFNGGKIMGNNLNEILYTGDCDDISVTYDRYNVHSTLAHHDGSHSMTYRMVKEGVDADRLLEKQVYGGGLSKNDISRYTTSLVPFIKKIYGV